MHAIHHPDDAVEAVPLRWECPCHVPPVLLGTYTTDGTVILKARDRYWRVRRGAVEATCPRCGAVRRLDPPVETRDVRRET